MFTWKHLSKTLASFLQNKTYLLFKKIMIIAIKKSLSKIVPVHFLVRLQTPWPCVWKKNWSNKKNSVQNGLNTNHIFLHQTKLIECCSLFFLLYTFCLFCLLFCRMFVNHYRLFFFLFKYHDKPCHYLQMLFIVLFLFKILVPTCVLLFHY